MAWFLMLMPPCLGALAAFLPWNTLRPWLLPLGGAAHLAAVLFTLSRPDSLHQSEWLILDPPGRIVLLLVSVLFAGCSWHAVGYLKYRRERSNRVFCLCLLCFLGVMSLVVWSHHLGLMWVAIEATTLVTAPLIYFNHVPRSIEATWKYLLVGSVGIALALLGSFFLAYSALHEGLETTLTFEDLVILAPRLSKPWLHAAFVLLLVGYGTKMGLAPMHTWKPDAYGEAPGIVGAILAGGVTSCAFLALVRVDHICRAAGESAYTSRLLVFLGLFSMAVAGVFMVGQRHFKRLLAYSSVEHMGILALGLGIGGPALLGTMLHIMTNGLTKGVLFLSAGNIHRANHGLRLEEVRGAMRQVPFSGALYLLGFFAITGSPPFGPFVSEFSILGAALDAGRWAVAAMFLVLLLLVFVGMGQRVLEVVQGSPNETLREQRYHDGVLTVAPPLCLLGLVLMIGVAIPAPLRAMLDDAVRFLEVSR